MSTYTIPTVVESTARGDRASDVYSRLLSDRIVFIGTPIDDGVANVVVAQLLHLSAVRPDHDIQLYINSPGGSFTATLAIYDTIRYVAPDVATLCVGQAASFAALLLGAGAPGKRAVLEHARVLLHQPHAEVTRGSLTDLAVEATELARVRDSFERILALQTGRGIDEVRSDTDRALSLSGSEAVDYGLADLVPEPAASGSQELSARTALRPEPDS